MNKPSLYILLIVSMLSCTQPETTQPMTRNLVDAVFASGYIIAEEEYQVTANAEGYLIRRFVTEGAEVGPQTPLFQLSNEVQEEQVANAQLNYQDALQKLDQDAPQKMQLQLQIEQAKSQLQQDEENYERYQTLWEKKAVSRVEYEQAQLQYENSVRNVQVQEKSLEDLQNSLQLNAKNAESQLVIQNENFADYYLTSRIHGEVLKVFKKQGELVRRGEVVALIGGGAKRARLYVSEEDIRSLKLGQRVVCSLNTDKTQTLEGAIDKIYPSFDETEQSFVVEASFLNPDSLIYHSTQLQANIVVGEVDNALVIPSRFLMEGDSVKRKSGEMLPVHIGLRNDEWVQVVDGVLPTDVLINPASL